MARSDSLSMHIAPKLTLLVPPEIQLADSPRPPVDPEGRLVSAKVLTWPTRASKLVGGSKFGSISGEPLPPESKSIEVFPSEVLGRFISLAGHDTEDLAFETFASRYGLLGLCEHQLPASHRPHLLWRTLDLASIDQPPTIAEDGSLEWSLDPKDRINDDLLPCNRTHMEELSAWRYWATQMAAIVTVSTQLRQAEAPEEEAVAGLADSFSPGVFGMHLPDPPAAGQRRPLLRNDPEDRPRQVEQPMTRLEIIAELQAHLTLMVDQLMRIADVRIGVMWHDDPRTRPSYAYRWNRRDRVASLFQVLVIGLAAVVTGIGEDGPLEFYRCDHCGRPHTRQRVPKRGQRAYCDLCKHRGPKAAYRAKQKLRGEDSSSASPR